MPTPTTPNVRLNDDYPQRIKTQQKELMESECVPPDQALFTNEAQCLVRLKTFKA